jgi:O-methyltransferase
MRVLRHLHDGARNMLGERAYARLVQSILNGGITRKLALAEFMARDIGPSNVELSRLHEHDRAIALSLGVQYTYAAYVPGDVAEFGTATGLSARVIARAMRSSERDRPTKRLHLFDSFEGLPEPSLEIDKNSFEFRTGVWSAGMAKLLTKDELFQSCSRIVPPDRIVMHDGWFKDTVSRLPKDARFSFVHFDGDLYESTIDAFGGLFASETITNGALVCFNGYNAGQADPNRGERGAWKAVTQQYQVEFSPWRAYGNLGMSFFVHDYRRA